MENQPNRDPLTEALNKFDNKRTESTVNMAATPNEIYNQNNFADKQYGDMMKETDPDLMTVCEVIKLPSKGLFYPNKVSELSVEYMTSKDEDLLTTPSLLENGTALSKLLRRKIKTQGIDPDFLLQGDRDAVSLFLRTSSYGVEYDVEVPDPRTGRTFKTQVDLSKLTYKKIEKTPDSEGHFSVEIPMRKKVVKFRLLTYNEEEMLAKKAEAIKEAYSEEFSNYNTLRLKTSIISIDGNSDRSYIDKFVDAMPARDALTIRKEILNVSPGIDMKYQFKTFDGFEFSAYLSIGADFFFPNI